MKILNTYLNFKNEVKEVECIGSVVFSTDSDGRVWHDIARDIILSEEPRISKFIMVSDFLIVQIEDDPSKISPIDNSTIFEIEENNLNIGTFVYYDSVENNLIGLGTPPTALHTKYNGTEWIIEASLEEQIEYYKNLIIQKTKELGIENLAGFGNPNLELELNELKKIHLEKSHELALQIENRLKEVSL